MTARPAQSTGVSLRPSRGFSMLELVASLAIVMILSAVAVPSLLRAYRAYLLSDAATRFAGMVKLTRFEAIRKNTQIGFKVRQSGANWNIWLDSNGNGTVDRGEAEVVLTGLINLLPSGSVPGSGAISAANGSATLSVLSGSNASVTYDQRGSVFFGGNPPAVYVFYLGNTSIPNLGARAVVLLPSGIVQVWTSASGAWRQLS